MLNIQTGEWSLLHIMLIRHDTIADATYVMLIPEKERMGVVARTKKVHPWLLVDYDAAGDIFGVEILNASENSVEDAFEELFGDPNFGRELRPSFVRHIKSAVKTVKVC